MTTSVSLTTRENASILRKRERDSMSCDRCKVSGSGPNHAASDSQRISNLKEAWKEVRDPPARLARQIIEHGLANAGVGDIDIVVANLTNDRSIVTEARPIRWGDLVYHELHGNVSVLQDSCTPATSISTYVYELHLRRVGRVLHHAQCFEDRPQREKSRERGP